MVVELSEGSGVGVYQICVFVDVFFLLLVLQQAVHDALVEENILGLRRRLEKERVYHLKFTTSKNMLYVNVLFQTQADTSLFVKKKTEMTWVSECRRPSLDVCSFGSEHVCPQCCKLCSLAAL